MGGNTRTGWLGVGLDAWSLAAEAATVAGLRMARMAIGGPQSFAEAQLMITEKVQAAAELQTGALLGLLGTTPLSASRGTLRHYRRKVAANRRRLSR